MCIRCDTFFVLLLYQNLALSKVNIVRVVDSRPGNPFSVKYTTKSDSLSTLPLVLAQDEWTVVMFFYMLTIIWPSIGFLVPAVSFCQFYTFFLWVSLCPLV